MSVGFAFIADNAAAPVWSTRISQPVPVLFFPLKGQVTP